MIYFFVYVLSSVFCELGFREKRKLVSWIFLLLAILIPAFLAGARDVTMGTDRLVYGDDIFEDVCKSSSLLQLETRWDGWIEQGYIYFNYLVSCFTENVGVFYFVLSFVENLLIILSLKTFGCKKYAGLAYAGFLFIFYQPAYNLIRQSFALSLLMVASAKWLSKEKFLCAIFFLLAFFIHHSSVVFGIFPVICWFVKRKPCIKTCVMVGFFVLFLFFLSGKMIDVFAPFLNVEVGRYNRYFESNSLGGFNFTELLFALLLVCLPMLNYKYLKECDGMWLYFTFFLMSVPLSQVNLFGGEFASRVVVYFSWMLIPAFARFVEVSGRRKKSIALLLIYMVSYWFYHFIYMGWNHTYPYISPVLGIW